MSLLRGHDGHVGREADARSIPNGGVAGPPAAAPVAGASASSGATPTGVPEYYVAWMQASSPYLVVGNTFTGQTIATINAPAGVFLEEVFGAAADDRTFVVTGHHRHGTDVGTTVWYLLRIAPGSSTPARLTPLPLPVRQSYAGVALSPDGTQVAVALPGRPAALRVYSTATGALLREWSTPASGELMAAKVPAGGSWQYTACTSRTDTKCAYTQRNFIGFLRVTHDSQGATYQGMGVSSECPRLTAPDNAAYLGWANADGSVIIGSELCAGHARFGIFSGGGFTPLPALPNSLPVTTGVLEGTFAW